MNSAYCSITVTYLDARGFLCHLTMNDDRPEVVLLERASAIFDWLIEEDCTPCDAQGKPAQRRPADDPQFDAAWFSGVSNG